MTKYLNISMLVNVSNSNSKLWGVSVQDSIYRRDLVLGIASEAGKWREIVHLEG